MEKKQLLKLCKYYHGEKENPFADRNGSLWWGGEKVFVERCERESTFFARIKDMYLEALSHKQVTHALADMSRPEDKRVLIFFLDLWHGRHFPYDSLDAILDYD